MNLFPYLLQENESSFWIYSLYGSRIPISQSLSGPVLEPMEDEVASPYI